MKKWVVVPLLMLGLISHCYAQGSLLYVGGGLGNSKLSEGQTGNIMNDSSITAFHSDNKDAYFELAVGARLHKRLYAELGYQKLGSFSSSGSSDGSAVLAAGGYTTEVDIAISKASLLVNLHPYHNYNVYLRGGLHRSKLKQQVSGTASRSVNGSGLHYGVGVGIIVSSTWQLQLEYVRYQDLSYRNIHDGSEGNMTVSTLGGRWLYLF